MPRPRPATLIALTALFISLGGTAVAARHYLITSTSQIKPSVLVKLHGRRGPAGTPGATGPAGPAGASGVAALSALTTVAGPHVIVPNGTVGSSTATCPAGMRAVSGGGFGSISGLDISEMSADHASWTVATTNKEGISVFVEAQVNCAATGQAVAAGSNHAARERGLRDARAAVARLRAQMAARH